MSKADGWSDPVLMDLDQIDPRPAVECRAQLNEEIVEQYMEKLDELPPIDVIADRGDKHWTSDGGHRYEAYRRSGRKQIWARYKPGAFDDAWREASRANSRHGLYDSNADKNARVMKALARPEWGDKSQHWIAEICGVSQAFVSKHDARVMPPDNGYHVASRAGRDRKSYPVDGRTTAEKRAAVAAVLRSDPTLNNTVIAERCKVSRELVVKVRAELGIAPPPHGVKRKPPEKPPPEPEPTPVEPAPVEVEPEPEIMESIPEPEPEPEPEPAPQSKRKPPASHPLLMFRPVESQILDAFDGFPEPSRVVFVMSLYGVYVRLCDQLGMESQELRHGA